MALLYLSDMLRVEGFERMHSQFTRLTILEDYPDDYAEIAVNEFGHVDLTSANFEQSTSSDDEVVVTVKSIPAVDVLYDDLTLNYIVLHGVTSPNYYAVMTIKSTDYNNGEAVVIPDFTITLTVNDSNQHLSADMLWRGNASFSTKCQRVMLCNGIPKTRDQVSSMHMGNIKQLMSDDFEPAGSGEDLRMMLKEQRMPPASVGGTVYSVAMLESARTDNFFVSRVSNPITIEQGAIVDINGVGFKIERGSGNPGDPRKKPTVPVKIDYGKSLSRDLLYFTFDFKKELVHDYDMPHVGSDITWYSGTRNVSFDTKSTGTTYNAIKLGSEIDDGNLLQQAITILFKFRQPNDTGTLGTIFCNDEVYGAGITEIDMLSGDGTSPGTHFWSCYAGIGSGDEVADTQTAGWHTYALTRGNDVEDDMTMYIDGAVVKRQASVPVRKYTGKLMRIGGLKNHHRWKSFLGELEYFGVWKRKLSDAEIAEFTDKPYSIFEDKAAVDKPKAYQAIDESDEFSKNILYYTCSWVDDIVNHRPIYPSIDRASIDPDSDNLIFDSNYSNVQMVDFGGAAKLSDQRFTVSMRMRLHANALSTTLLHALWDFPSSGSLNVEGTIQGAKSYGYSLVFKIGGESVLAKADWSSLSEFHTWSFTYDSNDRIAVYRDDTLIASKSISATRVEVTGGIRVGHNEGTVRRAIPAEVEYIAVWNEAFGAAKLHNFLQFPYSHLKNGVLQNKKPLGKGVLAADQTIVSGLSTYVFDAENEVIRDRSLTIEGEAYVLPNAEFTRRRTVFDIQIAKQAPLGRYETHAAVRGYRPSAAPLEPEVDNRTVTFRAKLLPKPPLAPGDVVPHQSTLFCCSDGTAARQQRWHAYYYGNGISDPQIVFEYGDMFLKYPYPLNDALEFHDFAFRVDQNGNNRRLTIWIDGDMVDTKTNANTYDVHGLEFRLGGYKDHPSTASVPYIRFKGVVDSYGIWDRALNEAEIKKLHREPYTPVIPNYNVKPSPDASNLSIKTIDLTQDLRFYTLDFKKELVHQYDMPKEGNDIEFLGAPTFNVKFKSNTNGNRIYLSTRDFAKSNPISTDNVTIVYKVKSSTLGGAHGNYYCIVGGGSNYRLSSHCSWVGSDGKYRWPTDIGEFTSTRLDVHYGNTSTVTPAWPTMAVRLEKTGTNIYTRTAFVDGQEVLKNESSKPGRYEADDWLVIGGWSNSTNYAGAKMEMEFFAIWDRALTDEELAYIYANPYVIVEGTPKALIGPTITVIGPEDDA